MEPWTQFQKGYLETKIQPQKNTVSQKISRNNLSLKSHGLKLTHFFTHNYMSAKKITFFIDAFPWLATISGECVCVNACIGEES